MQYKRKYNISIVSSVSVRPVNKIAFEGKQKKTKKKQKKKCSILEFSWNPQIHKHLLPSDRQHSKQRQLLYKI